MSWLTGELVLAVGWTVRLFSGTTAGINGEDREKERQQGAYQESLGSGH